MAEIKLPCGRVALIDDDNLQMTLPYRWYADKRKRTVYVRGRLTRDHVGGVYLHSLLTGNVETDHINGNGLDNRRQNLRLCTQSENCLNAVKKGKTKRFKGVYFDARRGKWWSQLYIGRKSHFGGYWATELEAAVSYDELALKYHGDFARLNLA